MIGAVLLFAGQMITALVPVPSASSSELFGWVADHSCALQVGNELKMFASVLMLTGVIGVVSKRGPMNGFELPAVAAFALAAQFIAVTVLVEGRSVHSVFGLRLSAASADLVVSLLCGTPTPWTSSSPVRH